MAGPNLPINVGTGTATGHYSHTNSVHGIANAFDTGLKTASSGNVLAWNGSVYAPATVSGTTGAIVTPETHGAAGNGTTNDQTALTNAIAACNAGDTLRLTAKYAHNNTITVNKSINIDGGGELIGTVQTACAVLVTANNVTMTNIRVTIQSTTRQSTANAGGVQVGTSGPVTGFRATNVSITGAGFGILDGSSYWVLTDCVVRDSLADAFHITGGSHHGRLINPTAIHPGDDGVAIVSYTSNASTCSDIEVIRPSVQNGYNGRGVTCVGGTDITFYDVHVNQNNGCGIYIAAENNGDWITRPPVRVRVVGGVIENTCMLPPNAGPDLAAIMIRNEWTSGTVLTDVTVAGVVVRNTFATFRTIDVSGGYSGGAVNVTLADLVIEGRNPRSQVLSSNTTNFVQRNIVYGVTQYQIHPSENITAANGQLYGAPGSTAVLSNGTIHMKYGTGQENQGWFQLGTATDTKAPTIPTNLVATAGTGQVALTWTASTDTVGVTKYYVYRVSNNNTRPGQIVASPTTNSYTNTGLTAGTEYRYAVSAVDAAGNESYLSNLGIATPT